MLILILGLFAGLTLVWLVFRLAIVALPLYAGLGIGLWLLHHGHGYAAAIFAGFSVGVATLAAGQLLFRLVRSPMLRLAIVMLFVLPATLAGYQAVYGLAGLAFGKGIGAILLSFIGSAFVARSAWRQLTAPSDGMDVSIHSNAATGSGLT